MNRIILAIAMAAIAVPAFAQPVVPAQSLAPVETPPGKVQALIKLGAEFPAMKGFDFSQTLTTVAPGTGRALHTHTGAPEIVRILQGTLTDSRNGGPPTAYPAGSTLLNTAGTTHMWANLGTETVIFVNTVVRAEPAPAPAK